MKQIIQNRGYFYALSAILFVGSILLWIAWGLKLGIDFTGGSLMEIEYNPERPSVSDIRSALAPSNIEGINIQTAGERGYIMRFREITEDTHQSMLEALRSAGGESSFTEKRFTSIGPSIGKELRTKSLYATVIVLIGIIVYIAWAFRKVSYPVQSWRYGVSAIAALFHDIIITIGLFVILGKYVGIEINTPFIAAILTILGYSVNDTIVVFDRIRENLHRYEGEFEEIVNKSVQETLVRSINTSLTVLLVLTAVFFFGGASIRDFTIALGFGVFIGTYSSIFIASALLVDWQRFTSKVRE